MLTHKKRKRSTALIAQYSIALSALFASVPTLHVEAGSGVGTSTTIGVVASFVAGAGILDAGGQALLARLVHIPSGDFAIGTDGRIVFLGTKNPSNIEGQRGEFRVSGLKGESVQISCGNTASLSNGKQKLSVTGVEMVAGKDQADKYGTGLSCSEQSRKGGIQHTLTGKQKHDTILLGAKIQVKDYLMRSLYSSEQGEGEPVSIEVNYI
jgi:hypothetical protein